MLPTYTHSVQWVHILLLDRATFWGEADSSFIAVQHEQQTDYAHYQKKYPVFSSINMLAASSSSRFSASEALQSS
jgi:hypothetical protein